MPNKFHQKAASGKPSKTKRGKKHDSTPMDTANWPGVPGKKGPNRSQGVEKADVYPKSEGI